MADDFYRVAKAAVSFGIFHPATLQNFAGGRKLTVPAVDLREEAVMSCQLLFGGVFEVGKTLLHDQLDGSVRAVIVSGLASRRNRCRKN